VRRRPHGARRSGVPPRSAPRRSVRPRSARPRSARPRSGARHARRPSAGLRSALPRERARPSGRPPSGRPPASVASARRSTPKRPAGRRASSRPAAALPTAGHGVVACDGDQWTRRRRLCRPLDTESSLATATNGRVGGGFADRRSRSRRLRRRPMEACFVRSACRGAGSSPACRTRRRGARRSCRRCRR